MKIGVFFKKIESMGTDDFAKWRESHPEEFQLLKQLNQEAREYYTKHSPEYNIIDEQQGEEAKNILKRLSSLSGFQTNFANNMCTAVDVEQLGDLDSEEGEKAFLERYPGLELKDYFSDSIEVFSVRFHEEFDLDADDERLFPYIVMAEGSIEMPISLQEGYSVPEGMMPFYGIFADVNFVLAGCWYALDYPGSVGWYETK